MNRLIDVSVVICAYTEERWDDRRAAVESVKAQHEPACGIIVGCAHNPRLLGRAHAHLRGVALVENRWTRGLSGARNSGIAVARGTIIAFMDEDAIAAPDWLAHLRAGYSDPSVMGVGGAIMPLWQTDRPGWFPEEFD